MQAEYNISMNTTQITIRKVDPLLKQKIVTSAKLKSQSINDWVLDAIRDKTGSKRVELGREPSWKKFVGSIPGDGISQEALDYFEQIDESMWTDK